MASRLISVSRSFFSGSASLHIRLQFLSTNPYVKFSFPTLAPSKKSSCGIKHKHCLPVPTATYEEFPAELAEEDSKFVPLEADAPTYGPPALLLLGFEVEEAAKIQQLLKELDGEFLEIIFCTEDMISRTLWEAVNTKQPNLEASKIAKSLPRVCFLSGLSGEEMMMFIDAFPESGLELPVFAALVPNSADKPLREVIEEIMGDHEMITSQKTG
ncbi:OLC1v1026113C1 [Oldenlandia corymbosa var. corymbosa]|uniref:OLC1v1026113C1 n=1 Tax=Oldenlandia corymbosa var. corymbosa TaxID=529605 RepID=A0AAV1C750_OLDCO|nr:OLC1v1026113C1 [Oldenlandia corymbosa var. corymbosa]